MRPPRGESSCSGEMGGAESMEGAQQTSQGALVLSPSRAETCRAVPGGWGGHVPGTPLCQSIPQGEGSPREVCSQP